MPNLVTTFIHRNFWMLGACHTLILSRDYRLLIFWLLLVDLRCWMPITVWNRWSFSFLIKNAKNTKNRGKRVFPLVFLDPSSPKLASGLPGPPNNFMVKKPTRLGELQLPQSDPFPINRCSRGCYKGSKVRNWGNWERRESRRRRKKEETRPRRYRIATVIDFYIVLHSLFIFHSVSFCFKDLNVIYAPSGVLFLVFCIFISFCYH